MDITFIIIATSMGSVISLLGSFITTWVMNRQERERWRNEKQGQADLWLRGQLQEVYSNALEQLSRLAYSAKAEPGTPLHDRAIDDFTAAQKWLGLLLVYHPRKTNEEFSALTKQLKEFIGDEWPDPKKVHALRVAVIGMAAYDERFQVSAEPEKDKRK